MKIKETTLQKNWIVALVAIICCVLWGSAFPSIKIGYQLFEIAGTDTAAQIMFAGCRFTLAGILSILFGSLIQGKFLVPSKAAIPKVLHVCVFQTVLQYFFFYVGLAHTTGVKGSIIGASNTFLSIVLACLLVKQEKMTMQKVLGCIIGFAGVIIINLGGGGIDMTFTLIGEGFMILSALAYSFSSIIIKKYSQSENPVMISGYQFLIGGIIMIAVGYFVGGRITVITGNGLLLLLYLAFVSAGAYSLWAILLKYNPVSKVAIYGFTTPVCGAGLSSLVLNEGSIFSVKNLAALVLVCIGIFSVNYQKGVKNESVQ